LPSRAAALGLLLAIAATPVAAQDPAWRVETATHLDGLRDISLTYDGSRVVVLHAGDRRFGLTLPRGMVLLTPLRDKPQPDYGQTIPQGRVSLGTGEIAVARLTGPTRRYAHGVLGDDIEAEALTVRFRDGSEDTFRLPEDSVFEDLQPRIVSVDGREAVLTVRSYLTAGGALALYGVSGGKVVPLAESRPIGQPSRWLNPVGAADFDGDGRTDVAAVVTPHLSGLLTLFHRNGAALEPVATAPGFANHFIGSTVLGMHVVTDVDGDGIDDIVLPSLDRRRLVAVTFAGGAARVLKTVEHDAPIVTSIVLADLDRNGMAEIVYGLADGTVTLIYR
jgi:hypothetical protein